MHTEYFSVTFKENTAQKKLIICWQSPVDIIFKKITLLESYSYIVQSIQWIGSLQMKTSWLPTREQDSIAFNFTSFFFDNERSEIMVQNEKARRSWFKLVLGKAGHLLLPCRLMQYVVYMSHISIGTSLPLMNRWSTNSHFAEARYALCLDHVVLFQMMMLN